MKLKHDDHLGDAMPLHFESVWLLDDGQRAPDAPPPVTETQLAAFQHKYGLTLPETLQTVCKIQNGGFSLRYESSFWPIEAGQHDDMTTLQMLSKTYHQDQAIEDFWQEQLGDLSGVVVFLGDGHFYAVLNYNRLVNEEPTVEIVTESTTKPTGGSLAQWLQATGS